MTRVPLLPGIDRTTIGSPATLSAVASKCARAFAPNAAPHVSKTRKLAVAVATRVAGFVSRVTMCL